MPDCLSDAILKRSSFNYDGNLLSHMSTRVQSGRKNQNIHFALRHTSKNLFFENPSKFDTKPHRKKEELMPLEVLINPLLHKGFGWLLLSSPFLEMEAWRRTMEPQKPGNSPGPGKGRRETESRQRVSGAKSSLLKSAERGVPGKMAAGAA